MDHVEPYKEWTENRRGLEISKEIASENFTIFTLKGPITYPAQWIKYTQAYLCEISLWDTKVKEKS